MSSRVGLAVAAALIGATGCGDTSGDACEPGLSVTSTSSVVPRFTWSPDCEAGMLSVTTEPGTMVWSIASAPTPGFTSTNLIRSGVVYGEVPASARQLGDLAPLAPGQTYRVLLWSFDNRGGSTLVGTALFGTASE